MAAEIGRQPWAVYNVLKTADAASVVVPPWRDIAHNYNVYSYICLSVFIFIKFLLKLIERGQRK